ncbi:hypothetical protein TRIUR3_18525 [Triticum urartu]|uniref:Uncharacterized protein n=1 Tax=Triticum urartu TaxID=4572 RepID=M7Z5E6_TRIUA|nr:hypothetical protein TRIUR3_18525 [Triticum urartu]
MASPTATWSKDRALMRPATTVALCSVAALAVAAASVAALRLVVRRYTPALLARAAICRVLDTEREMRIMEMLLGEEIRQVLGASSLRVDLQD